ncbi:hypothetical protein CONLIGDRAFT_630327 [Coniochaeta ligniaria NRRL 30616]|uniref:Uncharacterized protein n=1 Tax=Coniochaeta ligniaria NRRL 30616 TaxID=1408157 RepID=A0A1J7IYV2_9PEZI|nr:hypothetical protein CONLIGDRAFT_630327 [Coniochaeta ligniaria NRRL 30616]
MLAGLVRAAAGRRVIHSVHDNLEENQIQKSIVSLFLGLGCLYLHHFAFAVFDFVRLVLAPLVRSIAAPMCLSIQTQQYFTFGHPKELLHRFNQSRGFTSGARDRSSVRLASLQRLRTYCRSFSPSSEGDCE